MLDNLDRSLLETLLTHNHVRPLALKGTSKTWRLSPEETTFLQTHTFYEATWLEETVEKLWHKVLPHIQGDCELEAFWYVGNTLRERIEELSYKMPLVLEEIRIDDSLDITDLLLESFKPVSYSNSNDF